MYTEYGFNYIYGLAEGKTTFANDGLWGEIFGQFGFLGKIVFVMIFVTIFMRIYKKTDSKYERFCVMYVAIIMVIGSSETKTFFHFVTSPIFILLAFFNNYLQAKKSI